jgi:hypothetical protein
MINLKCFKSSACTPNARASLRVENGENSNKLAMNPKVNDVRKPLDNRLSNLLVTGGMKFAMFGN